MKKILSVVLTTAIMCSLIALVLANGADEKTETASVPAVSTASDWAKVDIEKAIALNVINADKSYNFQAVITRGEFCEIVYSYIKNTLNLADTENDITINITDTDSVAVRQLVQRGIIEGTKTDLVTSDEYTASVMTKNITFSPDDCLTREQAATILVRLANNTTAVPVHELYYEFDDADDISDWAESSVQVMCNMGVMTGIGDSKFAPKDIYTTEQAVSTIMRVYAAQCANSEINVSDTVYTSDFNYKLNQLMPDDKNYMISPLSLKMAFAMVANGAEGETQKQLLDALNIADLAEFNKNAKELAALYNSSEILKLNVANSLWINENRMLERFTTSFSDIAKDYYNAEVEIVNDQTAVNKINAWADEQTFGKIPNVISSPEFEAILANALYFKGSWTNEFSEMATQKDIFTSRDGSKAEIDFMRQTDYFQYYDNNGKAVIVLPYKSSQPETDAEGNYIGTKTSDADISMYLIQGEYTNHTEIIKNLAESRNDGNKSYIRLKMPKFELEFQTKLNDIMMALGATDAFTDGKAQFNPMIENGDGRYFITDSLQKTYIKVDEEGTEAAAVTIAYAGSTSVPNYPEPTEVTFDEPFTFVIYDNENAEILFIGEYAYAK